MLAGRKTFVVVFAVFGTMSLVYVGLFRDQLSLAFGDVLPGSLTDGTNSAERYLEMYSDNDNLTLTNTSEHWRAAKNNPRQRLVQTNVNVTEQFKSKYANVPKPKDSAYDQLQSRRDRGFFDGIPLRNLLVYTELLLQPTSVCHTSGAEMVTLVQSACPHRDHRNAIRETWGRRAEQLDVPVIFFVGKCPEAKQEFEQFKDIVEVNFSDSYFNNTIKSLARLKWFTKNCPKSRTLLMADDDTVVVIDLLLQFTRDGIGFTMIGPFYSGSTIYREKNHKWFVSELSYPQPVYPDYLGGWSYVVNGSHVELLFKASLELPFMTVDDALFTGFAAQMIGMKRVKDERFPVVKDLTIRCDDSAIIAMQFLPPKGMRRYWSDRNEKCKIGT